MHVCGKVENIRILIVEDEYYIVSDLHRIIGHRGGNLCLAYDQIENDLYGLDYSSVQMVIMDANLPNRLSYRIADMLMVRGIPFAFSNDGRGAAIPDRYRDVPRLTRPYDRRALIDVLSQRVEAPH